MHCGSCVARVKRILEQHPSVSQVSLSCGLKQTLITLEQYERLKRTVLAVWELGHYPYDCRCLHSLSHKATPK